MGDRTAGEGDVGFWELMSKINPPTLAVAGLLGIGFVLVVFILAAILIGTTKESPDVEIVRMRFAQVLFVGIITTLIFTSILYFFSSANGGPGEVIFDKTLTAMTPLAGVVIGYLFGSKTDRTTTERKPSDGSMQTVPAPDGAPTSVQTS
jgi:hypothetical protein